MAEDVEAAALDEGAETFVVVSIYRSAEIVAREGRCASSEFLEPQVDREASRTGQVDEVEGADGIVEAGFPEKPVARRG